MTHRPRVAVLTSSRLAPGLEAMVEDADRRGLYEMTCVLTTEDDLDAAPALAARGVPVVRHPMASRRMAWRHGHDSRTVSLLGPFEPDIVVLAGYLFIATEPLLSAYRRRIVNLHFSDLTLRLPDGRPRFPGLRAVRDALAAGQRAIYATSHLVDAELDGGRPLVRSRPFLTSPLVRDALASGATDMLRAYAYAHEQWMLRVASGPVLTETLARIARGDIDLDEGVECHTFTWNVTALSA